MFQSWATTFIVVLVTAATSPQLASAKQSTFTAYTSKPKAVRTPSTISPAHPNGGDANPSLQTNFKLNLSEKEHEIVVPNIFLGLSTVSRQPEVSIPEINKNISTIKKNPEEIQENLNLQHVITDDNDTKSKVQSKINLISKIETESDLADSYYYEHDYASTESQLPLISLFDSLEGTQEEPEQVNPARLQSLKQHSGKDLNILSLSPSTLQSVQEQVISEDRNILKPFLLRTNKYEDVTQIITTGSDDTFSPPHHQNDRLGNDRAIDDAPHHQNDRFENDKVLDEYFNNHYGFVSPVDPAFTPQHYNEYIPVGANAQSLKDSNNLDSPSDRFRNMVSALSGINPALYAGLRLPYYSLVSEADDINTLYNNKNNMEMNMHDHGIPFESKKLSTLYDANVENDLIMNKIVKTISPIDTNDNHYYATGHHKVNTDTNLFQENLRENFTRNNAMEKYSLPPMPLISGAFLSAFSVVQNDTYDKALFPNNITTRITTITKLVPEQHLKFKNNLKSNTFENVSTNYIPNIQILNSDDTFVSSNKINNVSKRHDTYAEVRINNLPYKSIFEELPPSLALINPRHSNDKYILEESSNKEAIYTNPEASVFGNNPSPKTQIHPENGQRENEYLQEGDYEYYNDYYDYGIATPQSVSKSLRISGYPQENIGSTPSSIYSDFGSSQHIGDVPTYEAYTPIFNQYPQHLQNERNNQLQYINKDASNTNLLPYLENGNRNINNQFQQHVSPNNHFTQNDPLSKSVFPIPTQDDNTRSTPQLKNVQQRFTVEDIDTLSSYSSYNFESILDEILATTPGVTDVASLLTPVTARPSSRSSTTENYSKNIVSHTFSRENTLSDANKITNNTTIGNGFGINANSVTHPEKNRFQASMKPGDPKAFTPIVPSLTTTRNPLVNKFSTPIPLPQPSFISIRDHTGFPYLKLQDPQEHIINLAKQQKSLVPHPYPNPGFPFVEVNTHATVIQGINPSLSNSQNADPLQIISHTSPPIASSHRNFDPLSPPHPTHVPTLLPNMNFTPSLYPYEPQADQNKHAPHSDSTLTSFTPPTPKELIDSLTEYGNINGVTQPIPDDNNLINIQNTNGNVIVPEGNVLPNYLQQHLYQNSNSPLLNLQGNIQRLPLDPSVQNFYNQQQFNNQYQQQNHPHQFNAGFNNHQQVATNNGGINLLLGLNNLPSGLPSLPTLPQSQIIYDNHNYNQHPYSGLQQHPAYSGNAKNLYGNLLPPPNLPYFSYSNPLPNANLHNIPSYPHHISTNDFYAKPPVPFNHGSFIPFAPHRIPKTLEQIFLEEQLPDFDNLDTLQENTPNSEDFANIELLNVKNLKEIIIDDQGRLIEETFYEDNIYEGGEDINLDMNSEINNSNNIVFTPSTDTFEHSPQNDFSMIPTAFQEPTEHSTTSQGVLSHDNSFITQSIVDSHATSSPINPTTTETSKTEWSTSSSINPGVTSENIPNFIEEFISVTPIGDNGIIKPSTRASSTKIDLTTIADIIRPKEKPINNEVSIFTTLREAIRGIASHPAYLILPNEGLRSLPSTLEITRAKAIAGHGLSKTNDVKQDNERKSKDFVLILSESDAGIKPSSGDYSIVLPKSISAVVNDNQLSLSENGKFNTFIPEQLSPIATKSDDLSSSTKTSNGHIFSGKIEIAGEENESKTSIDLNNFRNEVGFDSINMIKIDDAITFLESTMGALKPESRNLLEERFNNDQSEIHLDTPIYMWRPGFKEGFGIRLLDNMHFIVPKEDIELSDAEIVANHETFINQDSAFGKSQITSTELPSDDLIQSQIKEYDFILPDTGIGYYEYDYGNPYLEYIPNIHVGTFDNHPIQNNNEIFLRSNRDVTKNASHRNSFSTQFTESNTQNPIEISTVRYIMPSIADNFVENLEKLFHFSPSNNHFQVALPPTNISNQTMNNLIHQNKRSNLREINNVNKPFYDIMKASNKSTHFFTRPEVLKSLINRASKSNGSISALKLNASNLNLGFHPTQTSPNGMKDNLFGQTNLNLKSQSNANNVLLPRDNKKRDGQIRKNILVPQDPILLINDDSEWMQISPSKSNNPSQILNTNSVSSNNEIKSFPVFRENILTQESSNNIVRVPENQDEIRKISNISNISEHSNFSSLHQNQLVHNTKNPSSAKQYLENSRKNKVFTLQRLMTGQDMSGNGQVLLGPGSKKNEVLIIQESPVSPTNNQNVLILEESAKNVNNHYQDNVQNIRSSFVEELVTKIPVSGSSESNVFYVPNILPNSRNEGAHNMTQEERFWLWNNNQLKNTKKETNKSDFMKQIHVGNFVPVPGPFGQNEFLTTSRLTEQQLDMLLSGGFESGDGNADFLQTSSTKKKTSNMNKKDEGSRFYGLEVPERMKNLLSNIQHSPQQVQVSSQIRLQPSNPSVSYNRDQRHIAGFSADGWRWFRKESFNAAPKISATSRRGRPITRNEEFVPSMQIS